jgi:hypothetical protein
MQLFYISRRETVAFTPHVENIFVDDLAFVYICRLRYIPCAELLGVNLGELRWKF